MVAKKLLARAIVSRYHGDTTAREEEDWFTKAFSDRATPQGLTNIEIGSERLPIEVLKKCLPSASKSELRRLIEQGGVRLNEEQLSSFSSPLRLQNGDVIKARKTKWFKILVN